MPQLFSQFQRGWCQASSSLLSVCPGWLPFLGPAQSQGPLEQECSGKVARPPDRSPGWIPEILVLAVVEGTSLGLYVHPVEAGGSGDEDESIRGHPGHTGQAWEARDQNQLLPGHLTQGSRKSLGLN